MADLTVKQKQIFDNYKKTHPKMSDAEILSALVNLGQIQLSDYWWRNEGCWNCI